MENTREIKTTALPQLDNGEIWGTNSLGIFVVISQRPAQWHGEDSDVYGHINTWTVIRPANDAEQALWNHAVEASGARRAQRKNLHAETFQFSESTNDLCPPPAATRRLDSYDDRWQPPVCIPLSPAQIEIERNYIIARANLKGNK